MSRSSLQNSRLGTLMILLVSNRMTSLKKNSQEEEKCCEVSQDTDEFLVHPIKYWCILLTSICPTMVYTVPFLSIYIFILVSIASINWFVLVFWKSIIVDFIAICQKIIYIFSSRCNNMSLVGIVFDGHLAPIIIIFTIFELIHITTLSDDSVPPLNTVKLMVSKVLLGHENTYMIPYDDSYDLHSGNNDTTEFITIVPVGISVTNQLGWSEEVK